MTVYRIWEDRVRAHQPSVARAFRNMAAPRVPTDLFKDLEDFVASLDPEGGAGDPRGALALSPARPVSAFAGSPNTPGRLTPSTGVLQTGAHSTPEREQRPTHVAPLDPQTRRWERWIGRSRAL